MEKEETKAKKKVVTRTTKKPDMKLLVISVRIGFSVQVIEAAKAAGAEGAIVFKGRGVGNSEKKFFGLRIEPETEIVLMAVLEKDCIKISKAIYAACPYTSDARGQVLVLPLSHYFM